MTDENPRCRCDNCGWTGRMSQVEEMRDFWSRIDVGGVMPAGECPECGAFAYVMQPPPRVVVLMRGGCVESIAAERPCLVTVYDWDDAEDDREYRPTIEPSDRWDAEHERAWKLAHERMAPEGWSHANA